MTVGRRACLHAEIWVLIDVSDVAPTGTEIALVACTMSMLLVHVTVGFVRDIVLRSLPWCLLLPLCSTLSFGFSNICHISVWHSQALTVSSYLLLMSSVACATNCCTVVINQPFSFAYISSKVMCFYLLIYRKSCSAIAIEWPWDKRNSPGNGTKESLMKCL